MVNSKKSFKEYLKEIESPQYDDKDASWGLTENPTPLKKTK